MKYPLLLIATAETSGSPETDAQQIARLESELAVARHIIADCAAHQAERDADEKLIIAKMQKGLTREQAISVIARQKAYGKAESEKAKSAKP